MAVKHLLENKNQKRHPADDELREMIDKRRARIKVVGCGGAGNNTITRLMQVGVIGAETLALNTDAQDLLYTDADHKVLIGRILTQGLGAGANPKIGMEAAREAREEIKKVLQSSDLVFLTCGLGGGCLRGSSLIYTNPHGPVRIDSIKPGSHVYSLENDGKIQKRLVTAAMKTGIKKVVEVKTRNQTLIASYDHPFLQVLPVNPDKKGRFHKFALAWTPAELIKPGELVVTLRKAPEINEHNTPYDEINLSENFCRLFGFLLGDGWVSKSKDSWKVCFSPGIYEDLNKKYVKLMKDVFNMKMKKSKTSNWYYANSKHVYEILFKFGLDKHAKEKEIPSWIFELPDSFKKEFILGLADADGSYYKTKGKNKIELRFEMSSEKLIKQLKILCNYLGLRTSNIYSRTRKVKPPHSKQPIMATSWEVRIYKLYQLDETLETNRQRKGIGFLYGYRGSTDLPIFKNFGFTRVKSVKEMGKEDVYDITVEGSHNFVSEGFVVHNTGTGSLPVVADIAKKQGALTIAVVTLPFSMEGKQRRRNAEEGLRSLEEVVDTLIIIPNDKLLDIVPNASLIDAFRVADEILVNAVKGITELITKPGLVNRDFADVRAIMGSGGLAMIGMGESDTKNRAFESAEKALNNPLIDVNIDDAKGALVNITCGPSVTVREAQQIVDNVAKRLSDDAKIIWGAKIEKDIGNYVKTMLIITGVKSPQIFGPSKTWSQQAKKDVEKILGVDFIG